MILKRQEKNSIVKAIYESSNIVASTYNSNTEDLVIIFKSGTQYKYSKVSKSDYMRFEVADSQGKVFNSHIKKYSYDKLDNFDPSELLVEVEKLSNQEKTAILEAKRTDVINRLSYAHQLSQKDRTDDVDKTFNEYLVILKNSISDYLSESTVDNNLV
jgi:hypothetical protein